MSKPKNPFRCFNSSPEVIRMAVMLYIRYPLSLRNVEDLLFERGAGHCQGKREYFIEPRIHTEAVIDFAQVFTW